MAQPLAARVQYSSLEVALEELLAGPTLEQGKAGLYSEIPKGTHLLGYSIQQNVVTVNLSKEFNQGAGATSAIERVEELKKTVRSVNPNYRLKIAVEGKPLTIVTSDGLEVGRQI
jgi:spore germination protein GerM